MYNKAAPDWNQDMEKKDFDDKENQLKYGLDDKVPSAELGLYTLQHIIYFAAGTVVLPIAVGIYLGLGQAEIAGFLQRTFLLCGIMTLLQVKLGHGYPIIDAPAGLWASMFIIMAASAQSMGRDLGMLRMNLELGVMIAGGVVVLLAATGLINKISRIFTPIVNGVIITLMVLQMSETFMKGILGITDESSAIDPASVIVFFVTVGIILFVAVYMKGFLQSIATLIGVVAGWILALVLGISTERPSGQGIVSFPRFFSWGQPSFDPGITITCILGALVLLSMTFASVSSMADAVGEEVSPGKIRKTTVFHGLSSIMSGVFCVIPFMPFVSSTGVVLMTRVAAKKPFNLACIAMILFGLISPIAAFFASMPSTVAYATSMVVFSLIMGQGLKEFKKISLGNRECYIIGISMTCGMGIMFLPDGVFSALPQTAQSILSNGLVVGTLLCLILEQVFRGKAQA